MRDMCREVVKATYNRLDPDRKKFGFELFGLDFIVTCQFKPILI